MAASRVEVPKEYVRQQLQSQGIQETSEEDLEAYTRDFSALLQQHLQHDSSSSFETPHPPLRHANGRANHSPALDGHTPFTHCLQSGSAVFKTFPGDKENRIHYLPPSATPSPVQVTPASRGLLVSGSVPPSSGNSPGQGGARGGRKRSVKRKVLRKCSGETQVFDESVTDLESDVGSPAVGTVARQLSNLSITSVSSTDTSTDHSSLRELQPHPPHPHKQQYKSFIRPATSHPHTRGIKKCDPVTRYHEFRQLWESSAVPGEKNRNNLRWHIREQLMHHDIPVREPPRRVYKPNDFVVPTEKKRLALRWEVRHHLAQQ